jgi:hypothetical protein
VQVGDGRTFDQALRQLDKFIAEHRDGDHSLIPDPGSPIRLAYERIVSGTATA